MKPKPPHRPTAPTNRPPTAATPVFDQAAQIIAAIKAGIRTGSILQAATQQPGANPYTPPDWNTEPTPQHWEVDPDHPDYSEDSGLLLTPSTAELPHVSSFDDTASEQDCRVGAAGTWVYYQPLDGHNRATGMQACLSAGDVDYMDRGVRVDFGKQTLIIGSDTVRDGLHDPPGYVTGMQRGHLLGRQLGGSGVEMRNVVPIYRSVNDPAMKSCENLVRAAMDRGESVYYSVRPIYGDSNSLLPTEIEMKARGATVDFTVEIDNVSGYSSGC